MKSVSMSATAGQAGAARGLSLVRMPVQRVQDQDSQFEGVLREGSTGRAVVTNLPRVWAVSAEGPVLLENAVPHAIAEKSEPQQGELLPGELQPSEVQQGEVERPPVELAFYRKYTEALLRRYLRLSMQAGRVPSLMSREVFRGQVTSYKVRGFEEVVIFCHDVEQRLAKLNPTDQQLITRIALQRYSRGEAARILGLGVSACCQRYGQAVDRLTGLLLEAGLLEEELRR